MIETLSRIGEFGLIERIDRLLKKEGVPGSGLTLGLGDDCAAIRPRPGADLLVTCDAFVEGRHYLPERISSFDLGRRAMTANISDIGAMGGWPLYALVSLGLKAETPVGDIEELYRGFLFELNPLGAAVIGGNLTKSETPFIDITLIGEVEPADMVRRSTAKAGDVILVTGWPGQAAAGLGLVLAAPADADLDSEPLVGYYRTPGHRVREGRAIGRSHLATAMIDTSDGLLGDLGHICQDSRVGAELFMERLPVSAELRSAAKRLGKDPYELLLADSDDYELIVACRPEHVQGIEQVVAEVGQAPSAVIGRLTDELGIRLKWPDNRITRTEAVGWDHFKANKVKS